jgi:hypothetical protein
MPPKGKQRGKNQVLDDDKSRTNATGRHRRKEVLNWIDELLHLDDKRQISEGESSCG